MKSPEVATKDEAQRRVRRRLLASQWLRRTAVGLGVIAGIGAGEKSTSVELTGLIGGVGVATAAAVDNRRAYRHCRQTVEAFAKTREAQINTMINPQQMVIRSTDGQLQLAHTYDFKARAYRGDHISNGFIPPYMSFNASFIVEKTNQMAHREMGVYTMGAAFGAMAVGSLLAFEADARDDRAGFMQQIENIDSYPAA